MEDLTAETWRECFVPPVLFGNVRRLWLFGNSSCCIDVSMVLNCFAVNRPSLLPRVVVENEGATTDADPAHM